MVRCPECGANQVTGVVQKSRSADDDDAAPPLWNKLPTRWIIVTAAVLALGAGVYAVFSWTRSSANQMADQMANESMVTRAAKLLEGGSRRDRTGRPVHRACHR